MKRTKKIRIPKGWYCGKCKVFDVWHEWCNLFNISIWGNRRTKICRKKYPNGMVFAETEKKKQNRIS